MKFVSTISELKSSMGIMLRKNQKIGLIPTMGALHAGHLSLLEASLNNNDFTVVSIFVNPTQFNDSRDLERYPRNLEADIALLKSYPVDIVFAPSTDEMYPEEDSRSFNLSPLDTIMEGKFRPGHFNGVAQIVNKLFDIVQPNRAYFGLKDFQQISIIKRIVELEKLEIEIIACPIIREFDGLAMSSRNQLLSREEREMAPAIFHALKKATENYKDSDPEKIIQRVLNDINQHPEMKVLYFEIVDDQSLMPISGWNDSQNIIGCIAVQIGRVRLIDNRYFN